MVFTVEIGENALGTSRISHMSTCFLTGTDALVYVSRERQSTSSDSRRRMRKAKIHIRRALAHVLPVGGLRQSLTTEINDLLLLLRIFAECGGLSEVLCAVNVVKLR